MFNFFCLYLYLENRVIIFVDAIIGIPALSIKFSIVKSNFFRTYFCASHC